MMLKGKNCLRAGMLLACAVRSQASLWGSNTITSSVSGRWPGQ